MARSAKGSIEWTGVDCRKAGHKHSDCPYRLRVFNGVKPDGRRAYLRGRGRGTRRDAAAALGNLITDGQRGAYVEPVTVTYADWLDSWHASRVADGALGPRTAENVTTIIEKRIKPNLGSMPLLVLDDKHIVDFKAALQAEGLAGATVGKILGLVKQSLDDALSKRMLVRNPASSVKRPSVTADAVERRALDEKEVAQLVEAASGTVYDVPIRFSLATGVRQSEMLGARWADIDLDRETFTITQTVQHVKGEGFKTLRPKTSNSRRTIELSPATVKMLKVHRIRQAEERLRLGAIWQDGDLVFPNATGGPQHRRTFFARYQEIVKASKIAIPENVNWHCLRHTAASLWLKRGIDVFVVSRRLGHSNPGFTMRVYSHLLPGQQAPAAAALDDLLASG